MVQRPPSLAFPAARPGLLRWGAASALLAACLAPGLRAEEGAASPAGTPTATPVRTTALAPEERTALAVTAATLLRLDDLLFCNLAVQVAPLGEVEAAHRSPAMVAAATAVKPALKGMVVQALETLPDAQLIAWVGVAMSPHGDAFAESLAAFNRALNRAVQGQGAHLLQEVRAAAVAPATPARPGF